ncbi:Hypothetical protein ABZS17I87_00594 [Kosakonia cowanii]
MCGFGFVIDNHSNMSLRSSKRKTGEIHYRKTTVKEEKVVR